MPLYEYQCKKCERRLEKIQKFSDPILTKCEHCGGKLERLISSPAIRFKGSGWYVNDYARGSSSAGSKDSSAESSGGDGKKSEDSGKSSESGASGSGKTSDSSKTEPSKPNEPAKTKSSKD